MRIPRQQNRDSVISEVHRVLRAGGKYIFTAHNRDDSGEYNKFWKQEKQRWENGEQDETLFEYGDIIAKDITGESTFIHFSNMQEISD